MPKDDLAYVGHMLDMACEALSRKLDRAGYDRDEA